MRPKPVLMYRQGGRCCSRQTLHTLSWTQQLAPTIVGSGSTSCGRQFQLAAAHIHALAAIHTSAEEVRTIHDLRHP